MIRRLNGYAKAEQVQPASNISSDISLFLLTI
jgi:hypothetical protein